MALFQPQEGLFGGSAKSIRYPDFLDFFFELKKNFFWRNQAKAHVAGKTVRCHGGLQSDAWKSHRKIAQTSLLVSRGS